MKYLKLFEDFVVDDSNAELILVEGIYPDLLGTKIYINKFADEDQYRIFHTHYNPGKGTKVGDELGNKFMKFLSDKGIKYTKDGSKTYIYMDKKNAEKLKGSMTNKV